jgi:hypothetical protein
MAVAVRFSRSRGRYERQGIRIEEPALQRAEEDCALDAGERAKQPERRRALHAIATLGLAISGCSSPGAQPRVYWGWARGARPFFDSIPRGAAEQECGSASGLAEVVQSQHATTQRPGHRSGVGIREGRQRFCIVRFVR